MSRRLWLTLWKNLNLVYPYQTTIYFALFGWGVYATFFQQPTAMAKMMPGIIFDVWLILHMAAPLVAWIGQSLHHTDRSPSRTLLGWQLQWCGDAAICFIAGTNAYAFFQAEQHYPYLAPLFVVWSINAFLLSARDLIAVCYYWGACRLRCGSDAWD